MPDFYSQFGQWLADLIIVVRTNYDGHGEKQSFQNSVERQRDEEVGMECQRNGNVGSRTDSRLDQESSRCTRSVIGAFHPDADATHTARDFPAGKLN